MSTATASQSKTFSSSPYKGITFSYSGGPITCNRAVKDREEWLKTNQWDTISATRHVPLDVKYVVVDVETHDWNAFDYNDRSKSRIVEMAWLACDATGEVVDSKQYLIKPYGYEEISNKAVDLHGITTETAISKGTEAGLVFREFVSILQTLPPDGFVIAYNMEHEHTVFMNSFDIDQIAVWDSVPKCDIYPVSLWKHLPDDAAFYKKTYKSRKYGMTLSNLHKIIYPSQKDSYNVVHFASDDVKKTWDIFRHYKQHASYHELEWKRTFSVPSSKYTGIKVNSNILPMNRGRWKVSL